MGRYIGKLFLLSGILLIINVSCRKDFSKVSTSDWQPEIAAPFINTTIVLNDLFVDDSNLVTLDDSSLVYFYFKDSVFNLKTDTVLDIAEDANVEQSFSLGELKMDDFGFNQNFTINDMLPYLDQAVADTLVKYDGQKNYFPPIALLEPALIDADAINDFINLTFSSGKLFITLENMLPVEINNIGFELIDDNSQTIITNIYHESLNPGENFTDTTDLSGLILGNKFSFRLISLNSPGSYPDMVMINLNDGLNFDLNTTELKVISGQARLSQQIMWTDFQMIDLGLEPEQLYHANFQSGVFNYNLNSQLNLDIDVSLSLPSAEINGQIPEENFTINANSIIDQDWNVDGMTTDLTTDEEQAWNRLPIQIELIVLPTNQIVSFDSADKIHGIFTLQQVKLDYADGYLGKQTVNISKDTFDLNFDFLSRLKGELILEDPSISLNYTNSIGVPFRIATEMLGINTESGSQVSLSVDSIDVNHPGQPGEIVEGQILIDKNNSSIVDFLAIRPDRIIYYGGGISNPEGEAMNFVEGNSALVADAEIKIPLILRASQLNFSDTLGISFDSVDIPLQEGLIQLKVENGFPFDLKLHLVLNDTISGEKIDQITFDDIAAAKVDAEGKVIETTFSDLAVDFTPQFIDNMQRANMASIEAETTTFGQGDVPVKLFSDYEIKLTIGFKAKINP